VSEASVKRAVYGRAARPDTVHFFTSIDLPSALAHDLCPDVVCA
jgi:hypothetical protein